MPAKSGGKHRRQRQRRWAAPVSTLAAVGLVGTGATLLTAGTGSETTQATQELQVLMSDSVDIAAEAEVQRAAAVERTSRHRAIARETASSLAEEKAAAERRAEAAAKKAAEQKAKEQKAKEAAEREAAEKAAEQEAKEAAEQEAAAAEALETSVAAAQADPRAVARDLVAEHGWGEGEFECLDLLWEKESNWQYDAQNPTSSAYGIPQSLPGSKMASEGDDYRTNPVTQIRWGLGYIEDRYGNPCSAWGHSQANNWY